MSRAHYLCAGALTLAIATSHVPSAWANELQTYTYDALGRLTAVQTTGTVNNGQAHSLCYDGVGNRKTYKSDSGGALVNCTPPQPPFCYPKVIGPIPGNVSYAYNVTSATVLNNCSDPNGDTLTITSPAVPYTIYVQPDGQPVTRNHTVSDGQGGSANMTITVTRN